MKLEGEKFNGVATKVAGIRGAFLNNGDFRASTQAIMEETVAEILKQNNITKAEFSQGLEDRVYPHKALVRKADIIRKQEAHWNRVFNVQG